MTDRNRLDPSAFPHDIEGYFDWGMSLRDYFAAQALPAIIQILATSEELLNEEDAAKAMRMTPAWAYAYAEGMMEARDDYRDD